MFCLLAIFVTIKTTLHCSKQHKKAIGSQKTRKQCYEKYVAKRCQIAQPDKSKNNLKKVLASKSVH